ncbi:MAG: hypothetical protein Nk1A_4120 [Endomicrobiia bacterium]|nr:MAG: hypothetical protein Nk1A_4120 [Endomicrobiia bacterium]
MRKNVAIVILFNILFIFLTLFLFVYINIFFLFLISPFIPLIFFVSFKRKLLKNDMEIKQEIMDDIYQTISYTKRRYKNDLINKNITLLRDLERLKKQIDKSRINENCKKKLRDYLNKQIGQS